MRRAIISIVLLLAFLVSASVPGYADAQIPPINEEVAQRNITAADAIAAAMNDGYDIHLIDIATGRDMRNVFSSASEAELREWRLVAFEPINGSEMALILYIQYQGYAVVPSVEGMLLKHALVELHFNRFTNIRYETAEGYGIEDYDLNRWEVISQSQYAGGQYPAMGEILLICAPYGETGTKENVNESTVLYYSLIKTFNNPRTASNTADSITGKAADGIA